MLYIAWVVGVLLAIWASVTVSTRIEKTGKFDE